MKRFYITTPIYYVNGKATIGHAYTSIIADCLARWKRLQGYDTFFLTGTDENAQKTVKAAKEELGKNITRKQIKEYADNMAKIWKQTWKRLNITNDDFIRTTEKRHEDFVNKFFTKVYKKGDIYKGNYTGLYCEGCEAFYLEKDLVDGKCPLHKKEPKKIIEENYFFKLSKYQDQILNHIEKNPEFIQPKSRRNEVISFIKKEGVKDISISRPITDWGIPLPIDKKHTFWVWFDALNNYISANPKYWPASVHLLAKDILRFHCIIWPGMLISAGYKLPEKLFVHGFLTMKGHKMSKSLKNIVDPIELSNKYGVDSVRYFLLREISLGEDGEFSEESLIQRHNSELANDLGNLLNRISSMTHKYFNGKIKQQTKNELPKELDFEKINKNMDKLKINEALDDIWKYIGKCNKYINDKKPWDLAKTDKKKLEITLYNLLESIRIISLIIKPFLPETSEKIEKQLNIKNKDFKDIKFKKQDYKIKKPELLFKKITQ